MIFSFVFTLMCARRRAASVVAALVMAIALQALLTFRLGIAFAFRVSVVDPDVLCAGLATGMAAYSVLPVTIIIEMMRRRGCGTFWLVTTGGLVSGIGHAKAADTVRVVAFARLLPRLLSGLLFGLTRLMRRRPSALRRTALLSAVYRPALRGDAIDMMHRRFCGGFTGSGHKTLLRLS